MKSLRVTFQRKLKTTIISLPTAMLCFLATWALSQDMNNQNESSNFGFLDESLSLELKNEFERCNERCIANEKREQDDLTAQQTMAFAAERMNRLTVWQIVFGSAGMILLGITLWYTRRATNAAYESAKAAQDTVKAIPNIERAYVFLNTKISMQNQFVNDDAVTARFVEFSFQNHGKTPAIIREINATFRCVKAANSLRIDDARGADYPPGLIISAGGSHGPLYCRFKGSSSEEEDFLKGAAFAFFYGSIVYDDVFGQSRKTEFCYQYLCGKGRFVMAANSQLNSHC